MTIARKYGVAILDDHYPGSSMIYDPYLILARSHDIANQRNTRRSMKIVEHVILPQVSHKFMRKSGAMKLTLIKQCTRYQQMQCRMAPNTSQQL